MRGFQSFHGAVELCARGQEALAIGEGPAVILHVGEFDARGAGGFGEREHSLDLIDVAAMNHEIQGHCHANLLEPVEHAEFLGVGFRAGNFVGGFFARALKAELQVIEAGVD